MKPKLAMLLFAALACGTAPAVAQIVGSAQSFTVLGSATVTNGGATVLSGNLGVSPGTAITGFPPGTLASGAIYTGANAVAVQAQADVLAVYNALVAKPCGTNLSGMDLGGLTLTPGVYCFNDAATLSAGSATLTLDAQNGSGVFVFQIGTTLTTGTNSAVNVINGNSATGVFWQLGSSATLGTGTQFSGNILAHTSITIVSTAKILCGRALALNGAVTMDTNAISNNCTSNNFGTGRTDFGSLGFAGAHATHDFDADGKSDILWRQPTGAVAIWEMNGGSVKSAMSVATVSPDWQIVGVGDFDGDGKADILWRHNTGTVSIWLMDGSSIKSGIDVSNVSTDWMVAGVGDFDGDGKADILWRQSSGAVAIWLMNGGSLKQGAGVSTVPSDWQIVGVGDFNWDGMADILWRQTSTGAVAIWEMNGGSVNQVDGVSTVPADWQIVGVGDFDGDGFADILWRQTSTGAVAIWLMNGGSVKQGIGVSTVSTDWVIATAGDYDSDGKSDILWRHNSGAIAMWLMDGGSVKAAANVATVPTDWQITK